MLNSELQNLRTVVRDIIPHSELEITRLPDCAAIRLLLLSAQYPQRQLDPQTVKEVMENPLYWVFCWASGRVLAQLLLKNPHWVAGKRVLDFGCGSGVAAIAAALAGADAVVACDRDPLALRALDYNAKLNGVNLQMAADYRAIEGPVDLILAADVLYDRDNMQWLQRFAERAKRVLIADSRVKNFHQFRYRRIACHHSCTMPDLDESAQFRKVQVYLAE